MLNLRHRSKGRLNRCGAQRQPILPYGALQAGLNLNFTRGVSGPPDTGDSAAQPVDGSVITVTFVFCEHSYNFQALAGVRKRRAAVARAGWARSGGTGGPIAERVFMNIQHLAGAAYRALTASKDGPSLYDVCDPLLLNQTGGDPHLAKFYKTALGNPALRPLLRRTGLIELRDEKRLRALREALIRARDDAEPDWAAVGAPVAELLDTIELEHPKPGPAAAPARIPELAEIERVIRACGAHLLRSF